MEDKYIILIKKYFLIPFNSTKVVTLILCKTQKHEEKIFDTY